MTKDDVVRLAREAGLNPYPDDKHSYESESVCHSVLIRFAQAIEQHLIASGYRKCAEGQHTSQFCGQLEQAVRDDREACAKYLDSRPDGIWANTCGDSIRARQP